ncbi:hypothetical protein N9A26_00060 [bacterium]|nr:hypothetical protein [bacterium]
MNKLLIALTLIATFFTNQAIALPPCNELEMIKHNCEATVEFRDGIYVGEWQNGKRSGQGSMTYKDGDFYKGKWKDDYIVNGQFISGDGWNYDGEYKKEGWAGPSRHGSPYFFRNGKGTFSDEEGNRYVGEFKDGRYHGKGTFIYKAHGSKYVGDWKNGGKNGKGTYFFSDGSKHYVGDWKDGLPHGKGIQLNYDGSKYVGEFKKNKHHGMGILTDKNGNSYEGLFEDGSKDLDYEEKKIKAEKEKALAKTKAEKEKKLAKAKKEKEKKLQLETKCANKAAKASNDFAAKKIYESCMAANK